MTMIDLPPALGRMFDAIHSRLRKLENAAPFQAPAMSADPVVLTDGMIWYRSDLGELRCRKAGLTKIITTT